MIAICSRTRNIFCGPLPTVFRSYASALVSDSSYAKKTHPLVAGRSFLAVFLFTPPIRAATACSVGTQHISIHATRAGSDFCRYGSLHRTFLFTPPVWAATVQLPQGFLSAFLFTLPVWAATKVAKELANEFLFLFTPPAWATTGDLVPDTWIFLFTPPIRAAT